MKARQQSKPLTAERLELYRSFAYPGVPDQLAALRTFSTHRELFARLGDMRLATAAERAWIQDALLAAAAPVRNRQDAQKKAEYLQSEVDRWVLRSSIVAEHIIYADMIIVAIAAEHARWEIAIVSPAPTSNESESENKS